MGNLSPLGNKLQQLVPEPPLTLERLAAWKADALQDNKIDKNEAAFLLDQIKTQNVASSHF